jgi:hypothetical protein
MISGGYDAVMEAIAHDGDSALETGYGQRPFPI